MGGYRPSLFSEEESPLRKRIREGLLGDLELKIDPRIQAALRMMELTGELPPLSFFETEPAEQPPAGGWTFNPLRPQGITQITPPAPYVMPERPPWTLPPPKMEEKKPASLREKAAGAGLPRGLVNLVTPPPDLAEPPTPEQLDPAGLRSSRDEAARKEEEKRLYKERTGKQPFEFMLKLNVDEKGRVWFGL